MENRPRVSHFIVALYGSLKEDEKYIITPRNPDVFIKALE